MKIPMMATRAEEQAAIDEFVAAGRMKRIEARTPEEIVSIRTIRKVEEAIEILAKHGIQTTRRGQMFVADKFGPVTPGGLCALANSYISGTPILKRGRPRNNRGGRPRKKEDADD
jgi:hypothetical protein